jgi:hypothetical protein
MFLACIELSGGVSDSHIAIGLGIGALAWAVMLFLIWRRHRRVSHYLTALVHIIAVWAAIVPASVLIAESLWGRGELFVAALVVGGFAATFGIILNAIYRGVRGRALVASGGEIAVHCPSCGYSLVGLSSCTCPECGASFTIDALIRAQEYDALLHRGRSKPDDDSPLAPQTS